MTDLQSPATEPPASFAMKNPTQPLVVARGSDQRQRIVVHRHRGARASTRLEPALPVERTHTRSQVLRIRLKLGSLDNRKPGEIRCGSDVGRRNSHAIDRLAV